MRKGSKTATRKAKSKSPDTQETGDKTHVAGDKTHVAGDKTQVMGDKTRVTVEKKKGKPEAVMVKKKGMGVGATMRGLVEKVKRMSQDKAKPVKKEKKVVGKPQSEVSVVEETAETTVPERKTKTQVEGEQRNTAELAKAEWFFGAMPREYVEEYLKNIGDFAVRMTMAHMPDMEHDEIKVSYIISVKYEKGMKHVKVNEISSGIYGFTTNAAKPFPTIVAMMNSYMSSQQSLLSTYKLVVVSGARRPNFLLRDRGITRGDELGKGAFGIVYRATLNLDGDEEKTVVQKRTRAKTTDDQRKELVREALLLLECKHENVVECMGLQVDTFPIAIIMEICNKGGLDSYLVKGKATMENKMQWTKQAAAGLASLESHGILHRDIAARNCLLKGPRADLKLSDLGLAKHADKNGEYIDKDRKSIPARWSAPEVLLHGRCTHKSDVFSYAVLVWEIYNDGAKPWGATPSKVIVESLCITGKRLGWPASCHIPPEVKKMANSCWLSSVPDRPSFSEILEKLGVKHGAPEPPMVTQIGSIMQPSAFKRFPSGENSEPRTNLASQAQGREKPKATSVRAAAPKSIFSPVSKKPDEVAEPPSVKLKLVRAAIPKVKPVGVQASPASVRALPAPAPYFPSPAAGTTPPPFPPPPAQPPAGPNSPPFPPPPALPPTGPTGPNPPPFPPPPALPPTGPTGPNPPPFPPPPALPPNGPTEPNPPPFPPPTAQPPAGPNPHPSPPPPSQPPTVPTPESEAEEAAVPIDDDVKEM